MTQGAPRATSGRIAIIDDTVMTGNSLRAIEALVAKEFPNSITAAVYVNPLAVKKPDVWAVDLPWPHILEWNIFNSVLLPAVAVDFDGILCHDCHPADDDDGPRYMSFLENTKPMYLARRGPIPLIVTARLEKYREVTERWLNKWGMRANRLIMGHWSSLHERNRSDVAAYKAKHFMDFMRHHTGIKPAMFIESDPRQAERIASLSRGVVVCPAAGRCY